MLNAASADLALRRHDIGANVDAIADYCAGLMGETEIAVLRTAVRRKLTYQYPLPRTGSGGVVSSKELTRCSIPVPTGATPAAFRMVLLHDMITGEAIGVNVWRCKLTAFGKLVLRRIDTP